MKKLTIISAAISLFALSACDIAAFKGDPELALLSGTDAFKAPVLSAHSDVTADQDNIKTEEVSFCWTDADFGQSVQIEYSLYLKYNGETALLGQTSYTSYAISKSDYMGVLCNSLNAEKNARITGVQTYVTAKPAESDYAPISSNIITYDATTYIPVKRQIYLPGKYNDWSQYGCPFWETDGGTNIYKILVDVSNSDETPYYFKLFISGDDWRGFDKVVPDGWTVVDESNKDSNYSVAEGCGKVWLIVNLSTKKISKTDITDVEIIGDCDGWAGTAMTYDPAENVWKADATFASDGEMLVRLNKQWNGMKFGNGTVASEDVEGGVILDQDDGASNLSVAAGSYTMVLHANRTPFVLVINKK